MYGYLDRSEVHFDLLQDLLLKGMNAMGKRLTMLEQARAVPPQQLLPPHLQPTLSAAQVVRITPVSRPQEVRPSVLSVPAPRTGPPPRLQQIKNLQPTQLVP